MAADAPVLEVDDLTVSVPLPEGRRANVVESVSFSIAPGGTLGLVGESGSGKTMTSLAIMGLLPTAARVESGDIRLEGESLVGKSQAELRRMRGKRMAMVLQDPMTALDPSYTISSQLVRPLRQHRGLDRRAAAAAAVTALEQVQMTATRERLRQYPHQLSGGMRQRVISAIALAGQPRLLIADEPTTALDVTIQARYLQLLRELQGTTRFALLLVAHDLLVVRHVCEDVAVMYSSQVVEEGPTAAVFDAPQHPYTRALLDSVPELGQTTRLRSIEGQAPDPSRRISGCRFADRCLHVADLCRSATPPLSPRGPGRAARCWGTEEAGWIKA